MERDDAELAIRFLEATRFDDLTQPLKERRDIAGIIFFWWAKGRIDPVMAALRAEQIAREG